MPRIGLGKRDYTSIIAEDIEYIKARTKATFNAYLPTREEPEVKTETKPKPIKLGKRPTDAERIKVCDRFRVLESQGVLSDGVDGHLHEAMECMDRDTLAALIEPYKDYPAKMVKGLDQNSVFDRVMGQIHDAHNKGQLTAAEADQLQTEAEELDPVELYQFAHEHDLDPLSKQERAAHYAHTSDGGLDAFFGIIGGLILFIGSLSGFSQGYNVLKASVVFPILFIGLCMGVFAIVHYSFPIPKNWHKGGEATGEYDEDNYMIYKTEYKVGQLRQIAMQRAHYARVAWFIAAPIIALAVFSWWHFALSHVI